MGTHITQQQLDDIVQLRNNGATPKQVWERLAQYGDAYADGAVNVFRPDSNGWYVVRSIWDETGADIRKFDSVARRHVDQYIDLVKVSRDSQVFRLPNSAQIEDSYVSALEANGLTAKTAIDVVISKMKTAEPVQNVHILNWYSTPKIMWLEDAREAESFPHTMNKLSYQEANHIYKKVRSSVISQESQEAYLRADRKLPQISKDGSWGITPIQGVYFYRNSRTENWAIYDKNGEGILYLDGRKEQINPFNFRLRPDAQHEFLKDGRWQIVEMSPTQEFSPEFANARALTASLHESGHPSLTPSTQTNNKQGLLSQPLAVNASVQEVGRYAFAALLSDDEDVMHAALDQVFDTDVAKDRLQQAQQAVIAYDNQQAQMQQMETPVRVMKM